jgi:plastocyanin
VIPVGIVNRRGMVRSFRRQSFFVTLLLAALLAGCRREATPAQKTVELYVESDGDFLAFRPDTLTCPTGVLVRVTFHHAGKILSARHNWMLVYPAALEPLTQDALANDGIIAKDDPRVMAATDICDRGQSVTTQFVAPAPGDYPFLCSTHPEDMRGILHVTK